MSLREGLTHGEAVHRYGYELACQNCRINAYHDGYNGRMVSYRNEIPEYLCAACGEKLVAKAVADATWHKRNE